MPNSNFIAPVFLFLEVSYKVKFIKKHTASLLPVPQKLFTEHQEGTKTSLDTGLVTGSR